MVRRLLAAVVALSLFVGGLLAAEGVVVKFEKNSLTVKIGSEEKTYKLNKKTHVHDVDGKEISGKDRAKALKAGVKVEIEETGGKVKEINIKK
jgi:hypothetical protein